MSTSETTPRAMSDGASGADAASGRIRRLGDDVRVVRRAGAARAGASSRASATRSSTTQPAARKSSSLDGGGRAERLIERCERPAMARRRRRTSAAEQARGASTSIERGEAREQARAGAPDRRRGAAGGGDHGAHLRAAARPDRALDRARRWRCRCSSGAGCRSCARPGRGRACAPTNMDTLIALSTLASFGYSTVHAPERRARATCTASRSASSTCRSTTTWARSSSRRC